MSRTTHVLGMFLMFVSTNVMAAPSAQSCNPDVDPMVYISAACQKSRCEGHKAFHAPLPSHRLACSQQIEVQIASLSKDDQVLAASVLKRMKRRDGAVALTVVPAGKTCKESGSV